MKDTIVFRWQSYIKEKRTAKNHALFTLLFCLLFVYFLDTSGLNILASNSSLRKGYAVSP